MKIAILGYSGSGKSTLAKHLASTYDIPVLYLDTVQFLPYWRERDRDEARAIVAEFMQQKSWVIDGNYATFLQEERLAQADYIIYLNFPRFVCLWRILKRYCRYKNISRESITDDCNEKIDLEFIWWVLYEGRTQSKRRHYKQIVNTYKGKSIVLKNQKQLDEFMSAPFDLK
ncbi:MAG: DNA topology modulation protein [Clostridia bacterium]